MCEFLRTRVDKRTMNIRHPLSKLSVAAAMQCFALTAGAGSPAFELGLEALNDYRYTVALMHFKQAAEQGDLEAQRNLGLMLFYGSKLYGADVQSNHEQARHWFESAARQGCEVSSMMLKLMSQPPH